MSEIDNDETSDALTEAAFEEMPMDYDISKDSF